MLEGLRPAHYKKGEDTFSWAERKFDRDTNLAIASFLIHKYVDRNKGQDYEDFGKIADYAMWARGLMEKPVNDTTSKPRQTVMNFGEDTTCHG